jgi:hypothetical protein
MNVWIGGSAVQLVSMIVRLFRMMGWGGLANGALMTMAEKEFDVFVTGDRNLSFQPDIRRFDMVIVFLHGVGTQFNDTQPMLPKMLALLPTARRGEVVNIYP